MSANNLQLVSKQIIAVNQPGTADHIIVTHNGTRAGFKIACSVARRVRGSSCGRPAIISIEEADIVTCDHGPRFCTVITDAEEMVGARITPRVAVLSMAA